MKLLDKQKHFMSLLPRLVDYIYDQSWSCTIGDGYRHPDAVFPYHSHPNSMHTKRLAIDLNFFDEQGEYVTESERLKMFGEYWMRLDPNCTWGGTKDGNHFSMYSADFGMKF